MGWLYQLFFPAHTLTENELEMGRYRIIAEGAVAGVIYTVATGNFLAGYLSSLGASVSLCAAAAMIPSFGCVLQFISPFVFERMHHRKLAIWLMCVVFRLSVSSILLIPLALPDPGHARAVVLVLYTIGFFSAGLVTPGLEHMVLAIAPKAGAVSSTPSRALSEPAFPARQHLHLVAYWIIIWNRGRAIPAFLSSVLSACRLLWWMPFCLLR